MENLTMEAAIELLLQAKKPSQQQIEVPLQAALGKVCTQAIKAPYNNPPFARSPLDGYAFTAAMTQSATAQQPARFVVDGEVCAGHCWTQPVAAGHAIRLMTGAPLPVGCDCVIRQEDIELAPDGALLVPYSLQKYENYCFCGEDIKAGTELFAADSVLTAAHIGVLASMGVASVSVWRPLRIALLSTGDEVVDVGQPLAAGKIYNSNLYLLAARLQELGFVAEILGSLPDDVALVTQKIKEQLASADVILTTGGVSVGKMDIMHAVVEQLGAKRLFWRLAMKPGSPLLAYQCGGSLGIALSGNPFAALATFELIARPVLAKLARRTQVDWQRTTAVLADDFHKASPGRRFVRAYYDGQKVGLTQQNASGMLFSAIGCNAFIDIPAGSAALSAGCTVQVILL